MRRNRPAATLLLLALLSACAVAPPPAPPVQYPAAARDRLVRIALAEWEEWGRLFIDHTGTEQAAPLDERREDDREAFPAVLAYWSSVPGREETIAANLARLRSVEATASGYAPVWTDVPWSAAFISFLARSAGYDRGDVPSADAHWRIVDALMQREAAFPGRAAFGVASPEDQAAMPGDILCATRSGERGRYAVPEDRLAEAGRAVPMHCDVVVGTRPDVIEVVGGNVGDAVRMALLPALPDGRLAAPATDSSAPEMPAWFVLFPNRAGR
ncbi:DUF2272 domain-containing protein [Elioraea sp.]|uniref:DUF2272 domain-containing protein n=1 Tax=Elioraea sp. TaxID=2185103 RepID=UPI0025BA8158|nr:DUF2272 domain-containing protein [Elioraea sp.]